MILLVAEVPWALKLVGWGINKKYKIAKEDIVGWWDENEHKCYDSQHMEKLVNEAVWEMSEKLLPWYPVFNVRTSLYLSWILWWNQLINTKPTPKLFETNIGPPRHVWKKVFLFNSGAILFSGSGTYVTFLWLHLWFDKLGFFNFRDVHSRNPRSPIQLTNWRGELCHAF